MATAARYVNRELLGVFVAVTAVLVTVTVGGRFISYLQEAALGKYAADSIGMILLYRLPGFLQLLMPFGFFLAVVLTLGRLHAEQEFEVLRVGGLGPARLLGWLCPLAVLVSITVGFFSLVLAPDNDRRLTEFIRAEQSNAEFGVLTPGIFHTHLRGQRVTYADALSADGRALEDVFMAELMPGEDTVTIRAQRGGQETDPETGLRYLVLENGHRYEGEPGSADYRVVSFDRLKQRLEEAPRNTRFSIEAQSTTTLVGRSDPEALAELHFRVALPLVVVVGGLMGVGIARTKPRQGRFARVVPALALFVAYYAGLVFARNGVDDGTIPPALGIWPVHVVFLGIAAWLLRQSALPARA